MREEFKKWWESNPFPDTHYMAAKMAYASHQPEIDALKVEVEGLRKAAWDFLKANSCGTKEERRAALVSLRAALEGK